MAVLPVSFRATKERQPHSQNPLQARKIMSQSVYKIIEMVGSSPKSWEDAAQNAIKAAGLSLRDLRIAEVVKLDLIVDDGKAAVYRARVNLSFKVLSD
jgi:flavin-binding protein dodecin